jgi:amino acid transporter
MHPHWLWRALLVVVGVSSYYAAVLLVGIGLVRYVGVARDQQKRLRKLTIMPYFSAILLACVAVLLNPLGIQLLWQSALPATAGGQSGLLWLQYYIPRGTEPNRTPEQVERNSNLIIAAGILALVYIAVLGRGITLHR